MSPYTSFRVPKRYVYLTLRSVVKYDKACIPILMVTSKIVFRVRCTLISFLSLFFFSYRAISRWYILECNCGFCISFPSNYHHIQKVESVIDLFLWWISKAMVSLKYREFILYWLPLGSVLACSYKYCLILFVILTFYPTCSDSRVLFP